MRARTLLVLILVYLTGVFLTYGFAVGRQQSEGPEAAAKGVFWPVYWLIRGIGATASGAEWLFTPAPPQPTPKVER